MTVFTPFKGITKNAENIQEVILPTVAQKRNDEDRDWFAMQKQGPAQFLTMTAARFICLPQLSVLPLTGQHEKFVLITLCDIVIYWKKTYLQNRKWSVPKT